MIEKKTRQRERERLVQPAHYKEVDTGNYRESTIFKEDVTREVKQIPIVERVYVEAIKDTVIDQTEVWAYNDGIDEHDFATEEDAKAFLREQGKA